MHGSQLCLRLVSETSPLPPAILRHHLLAQKARRRGRDGLGRAEIAFQGPRVGRDRRASNQRKIERPGHLRRLGQVLVKENLMSVQAGIWNFDGRPVDHRLLADISESLKYQGPDGEFCHVDGSVALLYRPFHTTAESHREEQPHVSRRGFVLTLDGRLDNRDELIPELRSELEVDPTDVAIVGAAFDRWETRCFRHFVGEWATSIWYQAEKTLYLAQDYAGVRRIYYFLTENDVLWCSHLAPMVLKTGASFRLNDEYIAGYLVIQPEAHLTPYREIMAVPPGCFVTIRPKEAKVCRYWWFAPEQRIRYKSDAEYEEHFRHVFRQAVRRRLRSDRPILAELSGGLDSSSIVCMADDIIG